MQSLRKSGMAIILTALLLGPGLATAADDTKEQLLALTGGKRVKVVWAQGDKIRYFDSKEGKIEELPFPEMSQPLLTTDGLKVLCSAGGHDDRKVLMYDTETKELTTLTTGKYSGLMTVWRDPGTGRDWVYVNEAGSDGRNWDQPLGDMYRFPIDNPEEKELFWDRTSTHLYFMLSADGTRACFEPNWSNIGQLNLEYDADGKIDQDQSVYKLGQTHHQRVALDDHGDRATADRRPHSRGPGRVDGRAIQFPPAIARQPPRRIHRHRFHRGLVLL